MVEKKQVIELRKQGLSYREIRDQLQVSLGSISLWVRDIELTAKQNQRLRDRSNTQYILEKSEKARKVRESYQEEGRLLARDSPEQLFVSGCMLYWAEGAKSRNAAVLCNSDPLMMKFYIRFLRRSFTIPDSKITVYINCYDDIHTVEEIEDYWLQQLNLTRDSLRKTMLNQQPRSSSQRRKGKLPYGVCRVTVNSTKVVHQIYGAIQEISGYDNPAWL